MNIKTLCITIVFLLTSATYGRCQNTTHEKEITENSIPSSQKLVLKIKLKYTGSHGWGHVYKGEVEQVIQGKFQDSTISLDIIASSKKFSQELVFSTNDEIKCIATFQEIENDKPYVSFRNAFIDQRKRTWELISLKAANKK